MKLSEDALAEFIVIWRAENPGKKATHEELLEQAERVLNAVATIYRAIPPTVRQIHEEEQIQLPPKSFSARSR